MIENFDEQAYLDANPDVKNTILNAEFENVHVYLELAGLSEIEQGLKRFHSDFTSYNEEEYLALQTDIEEAIEKGLLSSGFEHFCMAGYKEIIDGLRSWEEYVPVIEKKLEITVITGFDDQAYLDANPDVKNAILNTKLQSVHEHLELAGLSEIEQGLRRFHSDFTSYNEEEYLALQTDIKEAIEKEQLSSGFEHFCIAGYSEIIDGRRSWEQYDKESAPIIEEKLETAVITGFDVYEAEMNPASPHIAESSTQYKLTIEELNTNFIIGWVVNLNDPKDIFKSRVSINKEEYITFFNNQPRNDLLKHKLSDGLGGFNVELLKTLTDKKEYDISILLPNGEKIKKTLTTVKVVEKNKTSSKKNITINSGQYKLKIEQLDTNAIKGWVVNLNNPKDIFKSTLLIDGEEYITFSNNQSRKDLLKHKISAGLGGFDVGWSKELFNKKKHEISIVLPNGDTVKEILNNETFLQLTKDYFPVLTKLDSVTIIVPIYNAADDLEVCIQRLIRYTTKPAKLLLINDASTDERIKKILSTVENIQNITILHNKKNMGFTKTVNKGIQHAGTDDVIFLNSDARVTPNWLEGLLDAVNSDPKIATVTAMSDRAGAFSAPNIGNENDLPYGVSEINYATAFRRRSRGLYPTVPTGNGFCLYVRREAMDELGTLDEEAFPRGYGEENDFCMRARKHGWRNIIDDKTYVFHDRNKSFGESKNILIKDGRTIIDERYKDYSKAIKVFSQSSQIHLARFFAKQALNDCLLTSQSVLPRILYVVATQSGGTPQTNRDLMGALQDNFETWVLHCDSSILTLSQYTLLNTTIIEKHTLVEKVDPLTHQSFEYDNVISNWLKRYEFDLVHIRHLGWHSLSLPRIAKETGSAVVNSFHDFYTICPTVKLLDDQYNYCGGECTSSQGECKVELWPENSMPPLKDNWVHEWRDKFEKALQYSDEFVTTSNSAKKTISTIFHAIDTDKFHVIPHGRDLVFTQPNLEMASTIDILIPGNINIAKGLNIIKKLLEIDINKKLHFHLLGTLEGEFTHPRLTNHGSYKREDFPSIVKRIKPNVGAMFSIWDETWCHTLTELWAVGLPVLVLDFQTVAKRVKESGAGWIYKFDNIEKLYSLILNDLSNHEEVKKVHLALEKWQKGNGYLHTNAYMASSYIQVYHKAISESLNKRQTFTKSLGVQNIKPKIAVVCPASPNLLDAPGSTHVRIWERTINNLDNEVIYVRLNPRQLIAAIQEGEISSAIIQRNVLELSDWETIKSYVKSNDFQYTLDIDDDLLNVPEDKDPLGKYKDYARTMQDIIENANLVTVSTPNLEKKFSNLNKNIRLLPNALSSRLWRKKINKKYDPNYFKALYVGSNTHTNDFLMVLPALEEVAKKYQNFRLKIIGVIDKSLEQLPWWVEKVEIPNECKNYPEFVSWLRKQVSDVHVGLAPLENKPFNNTKSSLKMLEYAALELSVIASKGEVYDEMAKEAPFARTIENNTISWIETLEKVIKERDTLKEEGKKMRDWVLEKHLISELLIQENHKW